MAGGGGSLGVERTKRGSASKRKKKKRVGFVLDMTPLVDITFLLLTFFMFTTTMAAPQVMEMSVPPEGPKEVKVDGKYLLSIFVRGDSKMFYRMDQDDPQPITIKEIKNLSVKQNLNLGNKCIISLYVSKDAAYGRIVQILDELNLAEGVITQEFAKRDDPANPGQKLKRDRKFTIADLSDDLSKLIEGL